MSPSLLEKVDSSLVIFSFGPSQEDEDDQGLFDNSTYNLTDCLLPLKPGNCHGSYDRFYYNRILSTCQHFRYSGCQGNRNNFRRREECQDICGDAEVKVDTVEGNATICIQPVKHVACVRSRPAKHYYFDKKAEKCARHTFTGCLAGHNSFESVEECQNTCEEQEVEEEVEIDEVKGKLLNE